VQEDYFPRLPTKISDCREEVYDGIFRDFKMRDRITCDGLLLSKNGDKCEIFDGECLVLLCILPIFRLKSKLL
jgi:hypothetical protein